MLKNKRKIKRLAITMDLQSHIYENTDKEVANMFEKMLVGK